MSLLATLVTMDLIWMLWVCAVVMLVDVAEGGDFGHVISCVGVGVGVCSREREGECLVVGAGFWSEGREVGGGCRWCLSG